MSTLAPELLAVEGLDGAFTGSPPKKLLHNTAISAAAARRRATYPFRQMSAFYALKISSLSA